MTAISRKNDLRQFLINGLAVLSIKPLILSAQTTKLLPVIFRKTKAMILRNITPVFHSKSSLTLPTNCTRSGFSLQPRLIYISLFLFGHFGKSQRLLEVRIIVLKRNRKNT